MTDIAKIICTSQESINPNELLCFYLQFNRVGNLARMVETNKRLVSRMDLVKCIRMGQIYGFLARIYQKIAYPQFPYPLVLTDPLRRLLTEREKSKLTISERLL